MVTLLSNCVTVYFIFGKFKVTIVTNGSKWKTKTGQKTDTPYNEKIQRKTKLYIEYCTTKQKYNNLRYFPFSHFLLCIHRIFLFIFHMHGSGKCMKENCTRKIYKYIFLFCVLLFSRVSTVLFVKGYDSPLLIILKVFNCTLLAP